MDDYVAQARSLAVDIIEHEAWFARLPPSMKDERSQSNHDAIQAKNAVQLACLVVKHKDRTEANDG